MENTPHFSSPSHIVSEKYHEGINLLIADLLETADEFGIDRKSIPTDFVQNYLDSVAEDIFDTIDHS